MMKTGELMRRFRSQYVAYAGLSIAIAGLTVAAYFTNPHSIQKYLGRTNLLLTAFLVITLGAVLLSLLISRGWFAIYKRITKGLALASGIAGVFGVAIILVDLVIIFPAGMNVAFPDSLLFYPVIGFFAEILFHVLPLSLLLVSLVSVLRNMKSSSIIWLCIIIVSLPEALYQSLAMPIDQYPPWVILYVGFHVFLFNLFGLAIFKRYDFISMYAFRVTYYLIWHIAWGLYRLELLL